MANDGIRGDRRIQRRYPVALELEYKVMEAGEVVGTGAGRTGNMSSGGVLFLTEDQLVGGPAVELSIHWPAVSAGEPFMELRVSGRIVRSDANGTGVQICRYHFQKTSPLGAAVDQLAGNAVIQ